MHGGQQGAISLTKKKINKKFAGKTDVRDWAAKPTGSLWLKVHGAQGGCQRRYPPVLKMFKNWIFLNVL